MVDTALPLSSREQVYSVSERQALSSPPGQVGGSGESPSNALLHGHSSDLRHGMSTTFDGRRREGIRG